MPHPPFRLSNLSRRLLHLQPSETSVLLGLAVGVGLATSIGIWLFHQAIEGFSWLFNEFLGHDILGRFGPLSIVITLALAGFIVGWIRQRFVGEERHHGVAGIMEAVALTGGRLRYAIMPFKALASALSLGAGASVGPEDPSVQIGANIGSLVGQRLRMSEERVRLLVAAGGASAIAAAFNAPIAGVFFALEVILNGEFTTGSFGVVVLAAVVCSAFTQAIDPGLQELAPLTYELGSPLEIAMFVPLGLLLAPLAAIFIRAVYWQHDVAHRLYERLPRPVVTAFAGALIGVAGIFLPQALGTGRETMNAVLSGQGNFALGLLLALGLAKMLLTPFSLAGGFVGGVFAPSLFIGTMLGGVFGRILPAFMPDGLVSSPQAFAVAGMAAMMAGVVRAPITAVLIVFELTNDYRLILPIMLTTVVCVFLTERFEPFGIYSKGLARKNVFLRQGRDIDVMQGVTVSEAMIKPAPTIAGSALLTDLRMTLRKLNVRSLCVVDAEGLLIGIVTLGDLQRAFEADSAKANTLTVSEICTREVITAYPDDVLWTAVRNMGARDVGRLPVVKYGTREVVGMLSRHGIMRAYNLAVARRLQDQHQAEQVRLHNLTGAHVIEVYVRDDAPVAGKHVCDVKWPAEAIVASIQRRSKLIVPHGSTELKAGDVVTIVAAPEAEDEVEALFGRNGK